VKVGQIVNVSGDTFVVSATPLATEVSVEFTLSQLGDSFVNNPLNWHARLAFEHYIKSARPAGTAGITTPQRPTPRPARAAAAVKEEMEAKTKAMATRSAPGTPEKALASESVFRNQLKDFFKYEPDFAELDKRGITPKMAWKLVETNMVSKAGFSGKPTTKEAVERRVDEITVRIVHAAEAAAALRAAAEEEEGATPPFKKMKTHT